MYKKLLYFLGLFWSISGISQLAPLTDSYQPPQTYIAEEIRMLPGFHADSKNVIYNSGGEFIARSKNYDLNNPGPVISNPPVVHTPSLGDNYIYSRTYLAPVTTSNNYAPQIQNITYFDGLGRPKQNIAIKSTPGGNDLVTPIVYDGFGRQTLDYLPVPTQGSGNGTIYSQTQSTNPNIPIAFPVPDASNIYQGETIFSKKKLENSPLDRIEEQLGTGSDWHLNNKSVKYEYLANEDNEVLKFVTSTSWVGEATTSTLSLASGNYYSKATLYKNKVTDEDDNVSYEFKNGQGQTLLIRKVLSATESADTYYVYNEYDQLAFVISPKGSEKIRTQLGGANLSETGEILAELSYQYRYDGRNRLVEKKLPGKGLVPGTNTWRWELMVYDNQDRLVMTQDANLYKDGQWTFTKYDQFGRVAYTGLTSDSGTRSGLQATLNGKGSNNVAFTGNTSGFTVPGLIVYYDNTATKNYPNTITKLLSVNYYDTYPKDKPDLATLGFTQTFITDNAQQNAISTKGLPVASYLNNIEMNSWTKTFSYYDDKARVLATYSKNYLGGYTKKESVLDFSGVPQKTITKHKRRSNTSSEEITINERFVYDYQNRLKQHYHQVNNNPEVLLTDNAYDELSRVKIKKVGNNLQEMNYDYNVRSWMTKINDLSNLGNDLFAYKVNYNTLDIGNVKPYLADQSLEIKKRYNGNISQIDWLKIDPAASGEPVKSYGYSYDGLNRLKAGFYYVKNSGQYDFTEEHNEILQYDINGNINELERFAYKVGSIPSKIDELGYYYRGNRVLSITDAQNDGNGYEGGGNTIDYDANGNMINMLDKTINSITYNHLNLPNAMDLGSGKRKASNSSIYRADGSKLKKIYISNRIGLTGITKITSTTDYLDGFQYLQVTPPGSTLTQGVIMPEEESELDLAMEREAFQRELLVDAVGPGDPDILENAILQFVPTAEGYYSFTEKRYIYQYKDHLGNTRVSFAKNGAGSLEVTDKNDYYPFGMNHLDANAGSYFGQSSYKNYKYNGKELQETGMYDYGARFYMPDIGRWPTMDGKGELYLSKSPYSYANNTPINAIDPDGNLVIFINGQHGGSGASPEYWRQYEGRWRFNSNLSGGITYRKEQVMAFDTAVMNQLGDYRPKYVDGAMGGWSNTFFATSNVNTSATNRINSGFKQGKNDAAEIIKNLARDESTGAIVETIKIITHSMGGAYGKGYVKALKEYISTLPKEQQKQIKITLVADFDPFQAGSLKVDPNIKTQQFIHEGDGNIKGMGWLANEQEQGISDKDTYTNTGSSTDHSVLTFLNDISKLQEGTYRWNGSSWACTNCNH